MQPLWGIQRPDLLTSLMNMSLVLRLPRKNASFQILFKCPTPAILQNPHVFLTSDKVHNPLHRPRETSERPKVLRTWKCASRHNDVHFFNISTSKSAPSMVCFVHFGLEMCFAPQRRAIFHLCAPAALASLPFDPPEPQIIGKTQRFTTLLPFCAPASSFFSLFLCSDLLSSALLFSDSSHLCFSMCPYRRKFDF